MRYEKGSFIVIPNKETLDGMFSHLQVVYMWICSYADDRGVCFPSRTTIARNSGCSIKTVDRAIEGLCESGFLKKLKRVENGKNLTNVYQIMLLEPWGGVTESLPSVTESLGVASQSRTELNPILTKSTKDFGAAREVVISEEEENPKPKKPPVKYPHHKEVFALWGKARLAWLNNNTQKQAAENLFEEHGLAEIKEALEFYEEHKDDDWCPKIRSPYDLDDKWIKLEDHLDRIS